MKDAEYYINHLNLEPHIEGGYFKEIYRSPFHLQKNCLPSEFDGGRALATTIFFLLKSGQVSKFHQLLSDEIWFYHDGVPMLIHMINEQGAYILQKLGPDVKNGENLQVLIPAGTVFGAEPTAAHSFSLVSCMVTPGFDFRDFKLFSSKELCDKFDMHKEIIQRLNT
ncbi:MAG: cupin domain-containing protein [Bacteroidales bacterium]|nr:cupin domain-containing protein [Bacteroidales bacterium]